MPFFNYNCEECGQDIEGKLVKKYDDEVVCPVCGTVMTKKMSACSFTVPYSTGDWQNG